MTRPDVSVPEGGVCAPEGTARAWPGARARRAWMLFDWAGQPCHTLILTFIFGPYFASAVAPDPQSGQAMWGWATAAAGLLAALLAAPLGAAADGMGRRKPWVALFSGIYVVAAAMLWTATPGDPSPWSVLVWVAIALTAMELAIVFTNAMLPDLAPPEALGKLSGQGWALGYAGGVISLALMLLLLAENAQTGLTMLGIPPILGLDADLREGTRAVGPLSALWFAVFAPPLFLFTPDATERGGGATGRGRGRGRGAAGAALRRTGAELRAALADVRRRPGFGWFLGASMLYRDGLTGFYAFGGIYAVGVLGWSVVQVGIFGIAAAVLGAVGAWAGGALDHRFGPRPVVRWALIGLVATALLGVSTGREAVLFVVPVAEGSAIPDLMFTMLGGLIGAFGGALQASSRVLLTRFADPGRMTAGFGLYALSGKATAFLAPAAIAVATELSGSQRIGVAPVVVMLGLGWAMLHFATEESE